MVRLTTLDSGLNDRLQSAIALAQDKYPDAKQLIDKRLSAITPVYFQVKAGILIENHEGFPVIGDYRIPVSRINQLTDEELAMRIYAVAVLLEMEQEARPIGQWKLSEDEIEANALKYIGAFAEMSTGRYETVM